MARSRTVVKKLTSLTPDERRACMRLNLGNDGMMQEKFINLEGYAFNDYGKKRFSRVVLHYSEKGRVDGWSLVFRDYWNPKVTDAYFYVSEGVRRKGVGTKLMNRARKLDKDLKVHPYDEASRNFFSKFPRA